MSGDRRRRLRARYLSLGLGEFAAATTFAVLAVLQLGPQVRDPGGSWLWYAPVAPLLVVLVQAGCYWLAARRWVAAGPMPERLARVYRAFRLLDPLVFAAGLAALIAAWPERRELGVLLSAAWAFGVIEYLNYYVVRLSYPPRLWLSRVGDGRTPRLLLDVQHALR